MRRKGYLAIFIWLLITVNFIVPISVKVSNNITDQVKSVKSASLLVTHSPINITGNTELDAFCSGNGTDGLSLETAHVIEGYYIQSGDSGSAITINNTDRFLIIRNVTTILGNAGIHISNAEKVTITMSNLEDHSEDGIWVEQSQNINITGNYIMNNSYGMYFNSGSANNFITNNVVSNNSDTGIFFDNSSNNLISNNTFAFQGGSGIYLDSSDNNTIIGNNASYNSESGINLYVASNNNISNNELSFNWEGIYIDLSNNNKIIGNNVSYHSDFGIKVDRTENSTIIGNNISYNSGYGINVLTTENSTIIGNIVSYNSGYGINIDESNKIDVNRNSITYNDYGIYTWGGEDGGNNNTYSWNNIANNNYDGIELDDRSNDNIITDNNISNNGQYGLLVTDRSNRNTISRNNFTSNSDGHIYVDRTSDNLMISYNNMMNTWSDSVYLDNSSFSTVYNNTIFNCSTGVTNYDGIHLNVSSNYIEYVEMGIYLGDSNYSTVANNIIVLAESGIYIENSNHFLFLSNTLTNLTSTAIEISGAINGSVVGNFMAHNEYGFTNSDEIVNITVWLNYFYNHSYSEAKNYSSGVSFDNGTLGNYWGDYVSRYPSAISSDGVIWDTQYGVNGTSHNDSYPLVSPGNPSVAPSNNITYMEGDTGNLISWNITDTIVLDPSFSIFRNNILDGTGVWNSGVPIEVDVDGLDAGNHTFLIEISDGTAWGVNRSEIMVTVDEIPSPVIANSSQTILGESFTLGWSSVSGADSYKIYVNGSLNETSISTSQLIMLWTIGTYSITVTAVNGGTESIQSSPIEVTVAILSTPLITTMNQTINSESINVSWGEVAGAGSYNIYVNDDFNETTTNTFQIINLLTNGNYTITVTAVNGSIESEHSTAIMIIVEIDEVIPPNALDGVYISIVVAFAVGFLFFLSMKRQRVE